VSDPVKSARTTTRSKQADPVTPEEALERHRGALTDLLQRIEKKNPGFDRDLVTRAFQVAAVQHRSQLRASGEAYVNHPIGTAIICAELGLDSSTIAAALLHDVVEDTGMSIGTVRDQFGEEVALLVDGVTKLSQMSFSTIEEEQAENVRKMIVAMAKDIRVILIKLADRLHNMRTLVYLTKEKQIQKSKETLEVYAPLAHRLGMESVRWELEDLAFQTLHPRKYSEIQRMVAQRRADRERDMEEARGILIAELSAVNIQVEIAGRTKHFYSIYDKMVRRGKEFNEIFDLTALRVLVDSVKDCYAALGVIHSLWKPMPGRFKDYIAMPKLNMYQSLHTTVIGPQGKPLEIQIRTNEMHETAQWGIAAHWMYKEKGGRGPQQKSDANYERLQWLRQIMEWQSDTKDAGEFMESLHIDLFRDEVYVFTPKGEVKSLPAGSTPVDFAYAIHTDVGHRCVGAKVNQRIVPLTYKLQSGDIVEILTSRTAQGPSRDWLQFVASSGARNRIRQWFKRERREDAEHQGREALLEALRKQGLPAQRLINSDMLGDIVKELGQTKKEEFFILLGSGKISTQHVVTRIMAHLNREGETPTATISAGTMVEKESKSGATSANQLGIRVDGIEDVAVRLPQCCRPVPGDDVVGYISLGRGITVHRSDCPNVRTLEKNPERFARVEWDTRTKAPIRVEVQIEAYDRNHLLEDISRTFSESGISIIAAQIATASNNMVKDRFVFDVPHIDYLETVLQRIRRIDTVYDAYRVTPH
jgi:GTP diphosphokinase / guanosine-3',5'-bis(diphosphate) 3'-diphosphatase